jgi:ATP-dependent DNA helicase RecQ
MTSDDEPGINAAIQALEDSGLAQRRGQMVLRTGDGSESDIDLAGLEAHREHSFGKLDAMQRYAESRTCLRARILDYFADEGHSPACGNCGPCMAPAARQSAAAQPGDARYDEETVFHALRQVRMRFAEEANVPPYVIFADATLHEMARKLPRTRAEMLAVGGVGQVKYDKYGEAFLSVTRAASAPKIPPGGVTAPGAARVRGPAAEPPMRARDGTAIPDSLRRTWELYREGLEIPEIAAKRGFGASTIASHLGRLVELGEIDDISRWVDDVTIMRIRKAAVTEPIGPLGPLKEALGDDVTYEQLHLARAFLNRA